MNHPKPRKILIWTLFSLWVVFVLFSLIWSYQAMQRDNQRARSIADRDKEFYAKTDKSDLLEYIPSSSKDRVFDEHISEVEKKYQETVTENRITFISLIVLCLVISIPLLIVALKDRLKLLVIFEIVNILLLALFMALSVIAEYNVPH